MFFVGQALRLPKKTDPGSAADPAGLPGLAGFTVALVSCSAARSSCAGEVIVDQGKLSAKPGSGQFLARDAGEAAKPTGRLSPEFDPKRNFGAKVL